MASIATVRAFTFIFAFELSFVIQVMMDLRVEAEEETEGLDMGNQGDHAHLNFQPMAEK